MPCAIKIRRLFDERSQLVLARLVPGRDDLNHGNDLAVPVSNRDPIGLADIDHFLGVPYEASARRDRRHGQSGRTLVRLVRPRRQIQGQDIRDRAANRLLGESEVVPR